MWRKSYNINKTSNETEVKTNRTWYRSGHYNMATTLIPLRQIKKGANAGATEG